MRKSKIILLSAALLVAVMMLGSCDALSALPFFGGAMGMADVVDGTKYVNDNTVVSTYNEIGALEDAEIVSYSEDLALFTTEVESSKDLTTYDKYIVYNLKTETVVFEKANSEKTTVSVTLGCTNEVSYFTVTTVTYPKVNDVVDFTAEPDIYTYFYDAAGVEITYAVGNESFAEVGEDLVLFDGDYYRVANGNVSFAFAKDYFAKTVSGNIVAQNENYYYTRAEDGNTANQISVYDKNLKFVSTYSAPSYAEGATMLVLDSGDIFVQYQVEVDPFSFFYDVYSNGEKYNVVTVIVDPETAEAKEISCDYVVAYANTFDDEDKKDLGLSDEINNLAYVLTIEDKRVDSSWKNMLYGTIDDNGKIELIECVDGKASFISKVINANLWIAYTTDGQAFFVDAEGNVKADVTKLDKYNDKYIVADGKLFDYELNMVYDFEAEDLTISEMMNNSVFFEGKDGKTVLYADGYATTLIDEEDESLAFGGFLGSNCYYIVDTSKADTQKFIVYNENGSEVASFKDCVYINTVVSGEGYTLVDVVTNNEEGFETISTYYMFK